MEEVQQAPSLSLVLETVNRKALRRITEIRSMLDEHRGELVSILPYQQPIIIGTIGSGSLHVDLRRRVVMPIKAYVIPQKETRSYLTFDGPIGFSTEDFMSVLVYETEGDRIRIGDYEVLTNLPPENYSRYCELFRALSRDINHPFLEAKRLKEEHGW